MVVGGIESRRCGSSRSRLTATMEGAFRAGSCGYLGLVITKGTIVGAFDASRENGLSSRCVGRQGSGMLLLYGSCRVAKSSGMGHPSWGLSEATGCSSGGDRSGKVQLVHSRWHVTKGRETTGCHHVPRHEHKLWILGALNARRSCCCKVARKSGLIDAGYCRGRSMRVRHVITTGLVADAVRTSVSGRSLRYNSRTTSRRMCRMHGQVLVKVLFRMMGGGGGDCCCLAGHQTLLGYEMSLLLCYHLGRGRRNRQS